MDIITGDVIEIWLDSGEYGWEPILSGSSVNHLTKVEPREEPLSEPIFHRLRRIYQENGGSVRVSGFFIVFVGIVWSIWRFIRYRRAQY